jgi:hypothetical protein
LPHGSALKVIFSIDDGNLQAEGKVVRIDPGTGMAIQFGEMSREDRAKMHRVLDFVQNSSAFYDKRYMANLLNK